MKFEEQSHIEKDLEKKLFSDEQIQIRLKELGAELSDHYCNLGIEKVTLICITNGAIVFVSDLMRHMDMHVQVDTMRMSSYLGTDSAQMEPELTADINLELANEHVLILDDILDTGHTMTKVKKILGERGPESLKVCVLLDKKERREVEIDADFVGFDIPNEFVVGYGLDFDQKYRNLSCIGVLKKALQP